MLKILKLNKCLINYFFLILGIIGLGFGSHFFVEGAVGIAKLLGIPSVVIGMTIVAIGTSLPELATTIVAVRKNETSFAIGNVIGSNIMNILAVLGFHLLFIQLIQSQFL